MFIINYYKSAKRGKARKNIKTLSHNLMYIIAEYTFHEVFKFLPNTLPSFTLRVKYGFLFSKNEKGYVWGKDGYLHNTYLGYKVGMGLWEFDIHCLYICIFRLISNKGLNFFLIPTSHWFISKVWFWDLIFWITKCTHIL